MLRRLNSFPFSITRCSANSYSAKQQVFTACQTELCRLLSVTIACFHSQMDKCKSITTSKGELTSFLKNSKTLVKSSPPSSIGLHVVIGNESADLDSIVSAITYAFYLSSIPQDLNVTTQYIPVISIHQNDLPLRTEVIALFDKLQISTDDLVYINDVDFKHLPVTKVTLVDHNGRSNHLRGISEHVSQIIDHHEDTEDFMDIEKTIKTVGSCATLITEEIYYSQHSVLSIYPISELLLSAVLVDTYNLDLHSGRTTELDVFIGEILTNHTTQDADKLFSYLQAAKMNISSMKTADILRKDYKVASTSLKLLPNIGISSATISASSVLWRDDFLQMAEDFCSKGNINVLVIMFLAFEEGSALPIRELAVFSKDSTYLKLVTAYLLTHKDLQLQEKEVGCELNDCVCLFGQNAKLSRKFVLPLLQKIKDEYE